MNKSTVKKALEILSESLPQREQRYSAYKLSRIAPDSVLARDCFFTDGAIYFICEDGKVERLPEWFWAT